MWRIMIDSLSHNLILGVNALLRLTMGVNALLLPKHGVEPLGSWDNILRLFKFPLLEYYYREIEKKYGVDYSITD